MRWQRVARLGVAAAGLTCAAAIYFLARGHQKPPPPEPLFKPDKDAVTQGGKTRFDRRGADGELRFSLDCENFATYADERTKCQTGHLTTFDQQPFEAWAELFELNGKSVQADNPAEVHLTGHVKIHAHDGLEVTTDAATYNDVTGVVTVPGALHFARARMSGDAIGGSYDRDHDTLKLLDKPHFVLAPDASGLGAMDATSHTMTLIRPERRALLDQDAHILHDGDTLAGQVSTIFLTDDEQQVKLVELRQNSSVTPGTGPGSHPPAMRADDIDLGFLPNGRTVNRAKLVSRSTTSSLVMTNATGSRSIVAPSIDVDLAEDGQTVTRLAASERVTVELPASADTPARTIRAATLNAQGAAPAGLKMARFDRNVQFDEKAAEPRTVKSGVLVLDLDGQLDNIKTADFRQNVQLTGQEGMAGSAEQATYEAAKNLLHLLRPDQRSKRPHAENKDVLVDAESIDVTMDSNALQASGTVTTQSRGKTAQAAGRPSALFDETRPIYGSSAEFTYKDKLAVYHGGRGGKALLQQDENEVSGETLTLESDTNNLKGQKQVEAHFLVQPQPDPAKPNAPLGKPTLYVLTGDAMDYQDAAGKATFKGAPAKMTSAEGKTEGQQIDLWLASDGHSLDKFVVTGDAYTEMDAKRRAFGQVLTYVAATDTYTLTGPSSKVLMPRTKDGKEPDATGCVISFGSKMTFARQTGNAEGYSSQQSPVSCSSKIR